MSLKFLKFKGSWRNYQQRVLEELNAYLDDSKLNVVAAPGAGKTTLGIEVMTRLNSPTLILAPTITIRNQWKQRIIDAFIQDENDISKISTTTKDIKTITIITYQLLHSIMKNEELKTSFIKNLKKINLQTIVIDEAHHLRTQWYKSLIELVEEMNVTTISLTGTPPYDVSMQEWNNYHALCGPVDAEISIPELVKQGDLCKHQDLIWFSRVEEDEEELIDKFEKNKQEFFKYMLENSDFSYAIKTSQYLSNIEEDNELFFEDYEFTIALISFLIKLDELDIQATNLLNILGLEKKSLPAFNYQQAEILLNGILGNFEKQFKNIPKIKGYLKELELLDSSRKVDFTNGLNTKKILSRSTSKIKSIEKITKLEYKNLKNDLREVVLLDYIGQGATKGINILSVFDNLKNNDYKTAILTGTLIVLPSSIKDELYNTLVEFNIDPKNVLTTEFEQNYLRVETYGTVDIVAVITKLFNKGFINVLIGTQALLGEGWDSPCVNSLIIASVVGSFMLSNQMRGRAIRVDKDNIDKTSNIWHLVTLSKNSNQDLLAVQRRFNTFEGISEVDNVIQSGIERLEFNIEKINVKNFEIININSALRAIKREKMIKKWDQVFEKSELTEQSMTSRFVTKFFEPDLNINSQANIYDVIKLTRPELPDTYIKHRDNWLFNKILIPIHIKQETKKITTQKTKLVQAVIDTLFDIGLIKSNIHNIKIKDVVTLKNDIYLTILNCTNYERKLTLDVLQEMFSKFTNQRYILKSQNFYITVPEVIGTHKNNVKIFKKYLDKYFSTDFEIIFTRNKNIKNTIIKTIYENTPPERFTTSRLWI